MINIYKERSSNQKENRWTTIAELVKPIALSKGLLKYADENGIEHKAPSKILSYMLLNAESIEDYKKLDRYLQEEFNVELEADSFCEYLSDGFAAPLSVSICNMSES